MTIGQYMRASIAICDKQSLCSGMAQSVILRDAYGRCVGWWHGISASVAAAESNTFQSFIHINNHTQTDILYMQCAIHCRTCHQRCYEI